MNKLGNVNFENYIGSKEGFSEMGYQIVSHTLTLGYAVMLAALFYFILSMKSVAPKYRISSVLSVVVMVSAFLLLNVQANNWTNSFEFDSEKGRYFLGEGKDLFNNGYRYLNWLIDVLLCRICNPAEFLLRKQHWRYFKYITNTFFIFVITC